MSNLISIPFKVTAPVNLSAALLNQITNFNSYNPLEFKSDAQAIHKLRMELFGAEGSLLEIHESVLEKLILYYAQLSFVLTKFPVDISLSFPWYSFTSPPTTASLLSLGAFKVATPISLPNLAYERISILFNIAIMYLALGVKQPRDNLLGIKASISFFQNAAGTFTHLLSSLSTPLLPSPLSPDLTIATLETLINLSLAQAQESAWLKGTMDQLKNGTIAKLAKRVEEFYLLAGEWGEKAGEGGLGIPVEILNHLRWKSFHFGAAAQYRKSLDDLAACRYGDEIGRLEVAEELVKKSLCSGKKGVGKAVVGDIKGLQAIIADNLTRAKKDNSLIYLAAITSPTELPPILAATMVVATIPLKISNPIEALYEGGDGKGIGEPFFSGLINIEVVLAISVYDDRKNELVRTEIVGRAEEMEAVALSSLRSLGLPGSIEAIRVPVGLPSSLIGKSEEIIGSGGRERIRIMLSDVGRFSESSGRMLEEISNLLNGEAREDEELRVRFGTERWDRESSESATKSLMVALQQYETVNKEAINANSSIKTKFDLAEDWIKVLESDQATIEAVIPPLTVPETRLSQISPPTAQSVALRTLSRLLEDLQDLINARKKVVGEAKRVKEGDDIRNLIIRKAAQLGAEVGGVALFEDLFEEELGKYRRFKKALEESEKEQIGLLELIRVGNDRFLETRRADPQLKARELALQSLDNAYIKYKEIHSNLVEGIEFYSKISSIINDLLNQAKAYVHERSYQARNLRDRLEALPTRESPIPTLVEGVERVRLNPNPLQPPRRAGVFDPKVDEIKFFK